jgi:hypothetical protein
MRSLTRLFVKTSFLYLGLALFFGRTVENQSGLNVVQEQILLLRLE